MMELLHMDQSPQEIPPSTELFNDLLYFREDMKAYFYQKGLQDVCDVHISRSGKGFVLSGHVDCLWTRAVLLCMVPRSHGARNVIDKLHITSPIQ